MTTETFHNGPDAIRLHRAADFLDSARAAVLSAQGQVTAALKIAELTDSEREELKELAEKLGHDASFLAGDRLGLMQLNVRVRRAQGIIRD